jgi:outer membrane biosynthesis protein TonB
MNPVQPIHPQPPLPNAQRTDRPSTRSLLRWGALVLALHLGALLSLAGTLDWQLSKPQTLRTGPMQTRTIPAPAGATAATDPSNTPAARTRVALLEKPKPKPAPTAKPDAQKIAADPNTTPADKTSPPADPPVPEQAADKELNKDLDKVATLATPDPVPAPQPVTQTDTDTAPNADKALAVTPGTQTPSAAKSEVPEPSQTPNPNVATSEAAAKPAEPQPERIANATMALSEMALGSLPSPALLSYRLSGQEKGIHYQASGELRWQHNDSAYAMSLTVKAFLLGSRHWRSVGQINATGLAPTRFSDSWRSERAAHFDRPNQRIVFSSNAPIAPLQPGAQDQVSLYVQLAAAMAQSGQQMPPGTRLQIQTATVRDALPWLLTLEKLETLQVDDQNLQTVKWVCQPRNRFDAQVEFWVSAAHDWLPARIRITQVSGNFIDLQLTGRQVLSALPLTP